MSLFPAPPAPKFADDQHAITRDRLRYEDVAQDGRLMPIAMPPAMSGLWHAVLHRHPGHRAALAQGVLPILTRLTIATAEQAIRIDQPIESRAGFELAHAASGEARLFMNVWAEVHGASGRIGQREPGPLALAGRLFAEHTFTRPFAPPGQRRVERLDVPGYPPVPEASYELSAPATAAAAPDGATWLDELSEDPLDVVFTLDQTDSNQHVNSLVYVRVFLEAAQRRIAATRAWQIRSRAVDIAYRKPCFAGERARIWLRLFAWNDLVGAAGFFAAPGERDRPRCFVRVLFGT
ncbi:MAG: hypothetical protein KF773_05185 [Deltaproteobacteria bacterium]|nr:hypothetical protein [Deltaproteobacteria bacterium]MCW5803232.1 hypothetical protein [Deltaproteobacteria bacterium]